MRVMTWNIDHGADLAKVAGEMLHNPADLCLLQEVDLYTRRAGERDIGTELAKRLRMNGAYGIEFEELSQENGRPAYIGQATLTRLPFANTTVTTSPVATSRILRFERQSAFWKPRVWIQSAVPLLQRRAGNRIALVTELEFAGKMLVVYNAHLESRSAGAIQHRQIEEILQDSRRYSPETPILIGGDLNSKYFPSAFLHELEAAGFRSAMGERIERTHRIMMSLDWLFVRGPVRLLNGSVRHGVTGSDHFPVYATMVAGG
jgi:endonuclease/exonuclease/phosphatase family metal-dependent hydrolase